MKIHTDEITRFLLERQLRFNLMTPEYQGGFTLERKLRLLAHFDCPISEFVSPRGRIYYAFEGCPAEDEDELDRKLQRKDCYLSKYKMVDDLLDELLTYEDPSLVWEALFSIHGTETTKAWEELNKC